MTWLSSAAGAVTVTLLSAALTWMVYPATYVALQVDTGVPLLVNGSTGRAARYEVTSAGQRSIFPAATTPVILQAAAEQLAVNPAGRAPRLSAAYCPTAFRIAFASEDLFVLFACANCLAGLIAIRVIARSTASIPMTTSSSISVKPF